MRVAFELARKACLGGRASLSRTVHKRWHRQPLFLASVPAMPSPPPCWVTSPSPFHQADHLNNRFFTQQASSDGPLPTDYSSLLDEREFHKLADDLLHYLQEKFDELAEEHDIDGFDIDYAEGVLTIKLGPSGTFVINKQTPNRQIWLSSPASGPARFDWDAKEHRWIYRRTKAEIFHLLEKEVHDLLGASIKLIK